MGTLSWLDDQFVVSATPKAWRTALDLDFTGATDPGLSANGTYVIGGTAGWKREFTVRDQAPMAIGSTGLTIQPKLSAYSITERAAPLLWLPLSALNIPLLDWDTGFRIWLHIADESHVGGHNAHVFCGIDSDSLAWSPGWASSGTNVAGNRILQIQTRTLDGLGGNETATAGTDWTDTPTGIIRCDIPALVEAQVKPALFWDPINAPWPSPNAAELRPMVGTPFFYDIVSANANSLGPAEGLGVVIGAWSAADADLFSVTISRLRIDYRL